MSGPACAGCGRDLPLNGHGRCNDCQALFDDLGGSLDIGEEVTLETLVEHVTAAEDADEVIAALARAQPPGEKLERQRWREALLRAMRGKASSPAKIVDAWLGTAVDADTVIMKQSSELVQLVLNHKATLFHTSDKQAYAAVTVEGHREVMALRSRSFRQWLARAYWDHTASTAGEPDTLGGLLGAFAPASRVPGAQAVADAIATIEGLAVFDGEEFDVHVRVAHFGNKVYLDLGSENWEAVEIDPAGWRVVDVPPVMFRRPPGLEALPHPVPGGHVDELRQFVNVSAAEWPLVAGFVVALLSTGPYAVLAFLGEQGCGKSTAAKVIRRLVDPSSSDARGRPRSDRDLAITAHNSWVLSYDNLSSIPVWLSDALCSIATGGGFATRMLYTDDEERIFDSKRPIIVNGIGDVVARSDLLDRALLVSLPVIVDKVAETTFWTEFEIALPRILGAVLDAVAVAIGAVADVELAETPRMVDFARWATAAEAALGLTDGEVLAAYLANRAVADQTAIEASPIGRYVLQLAEQEQLWEGTASDLLDVLNAAANAADKVTDADKVGPTRRQEGWPKAANALSNRLKLLAPNLRRVGVDVTVDRDEHGSRITIVRTSK